MALIIDFENKSKERFIKKTCGFEEICLDNIKNDLSYENIKEQIRRIKISIDFIENTSDELYNNKERSEAWKNTLLNY